MILYIIRHGDPIYNPDSLTPLGKRQAEALSRRFCRKGLDKIFCSPQWRARQTAQPTCECLKITPVQENWMAENRAFRRFSAPIGNGERRWLFHARRNELFLPENSSQTFENWYEAPVFADLPHVKKGYEELQAESDDFFARLGFVREGAMYRLAGEDPGRVAVFCHQGFGCSWMSHILQIPPQIFWRGFDVNPSGICVFEFFPEKDGLCAPKCVALSDLSHVYSDGLPLSY